MADIRLKYGFPLFCSDCTMEYLLKNDNIIVSDIWAFWNYIIRKNSKKNGFKVSEQNFMFSLLEQAKYFYETAMNAPLKSQPLLFYYSFLNLAKIINMDVYKGSSAEFYHGLETNVNTTTTLNNAQINLLKYDPLHQKYSVAYELMCKMGCNLPNIPPKKCYDVRELLQNCVGIHRTYCEIYNVAERFYHIKDLKLERDGKNLKSAYTVSKADTDIVMRLKRRGYNIVPITDDNGNISSYVWEENWSMAIYSVAQRDYYGLSMQLRKKGLWTYTDGHNYRMYISETNTGLTSECIIYCLTFFFGSITRYHPYIFDSLLTDRDLWMISEFLKTQPAQFLLLVTSKAIGHALLKPRTSGIIS